MSFVQEVLGNYEGDSQSSLLMYQNETQIEGALWSFLSSWVYAYTKIGVYVCVKMNRMMNRSCILRNHIRMKFT